MKKAHSGNRRVIMSDCLEIILSTVLHFATLIAGVLFVMCLYAWTLGPNSCGAFQEASGLETSYDFWGGCYVTMEDGRTLERGIAREIWKKDYKLNIK